MHRPYLSVFGNLNHAWAMFRSTMVAGYPEQSSPPWPGELRVSVRSTIVYGGEGEIGKSVVVR